MKLIIAGGRDFNDFDLLEKETRLWLRELGVKSADDVEVVSGCASGADKLGEDFAQFHHCQIKRFHANWLVHGKSAGPIRNLRMAEYATHCICFWDGQSRGTKNMIDTAIKRGLELRVVNYSPILST